MDWDSAVLWYFPIDKVFDRKTTTIEFDYLVLSESNWNFAAEVSSSHLAAVKSDFQQLKKSNEGRFIKIDDEPPRVRTLAAKLLQLERCLMLLKYKYGAVSNGTVFLISPAFARSSADDEAALKYFVLHHEVLFPALKCVGEPLESSRFSIIGV
eukprot:TRINITY_DN2455_c0_g1_i1.p2 TRINITY_DN2455_c0_g1~~TRINITY_DN2455_c0_g1_i1.p2  ORF type:complete len:154 (-),score=30.20 TRINITY_DN2455_c0_g1_i1:732-1193(-)